jgi:hypothetical protein
MRPSALRWGLACAGSKDPAYVRLCMTDEQKVKMLPAFLDPGYADHLFTLVHWCSRQSSISGGVSEETPRTVLVDNPRRSSHL